MRLCRLALRIQTAVSLTPSGAGRVQDIYPGHGPWGSAVALSPLRYFAVEWPHYVWFWEDRVSLVVV